MATLRDIKNRIRSVKNTQQITNAMKMVAAAKLRRAQESIINARPYSNKISKMLSHLVTDEDLLSNPYCVQKNVDNIAVVLVTADRGLCGAFNSNIIKETVKYINEDFSNMKPQVFTVGKKGFEFFSRRDYQIINKKIGLFSSLNYSSSLDITNELINLFLNGTFDKIVIVYNQFKSVIQYKVVAEQFLPIRIESSSKEKGNEKYLPNYIFEPNQKEIFEYLIPKHLKAQMWKVLLESNAAELGAKMAAMDNATNNAKELIRTLQQTYNKERQAAITKEILEIVSGANALSAQD